MKALKQAVRLLISLGIVAIWGLLQDEWVPLTPLSCYYSNHLYSDLGYYSKDSLPAFDTYLSLWILIGGFFAQSSLSAKYCQSDTSEHHGKFRFRFFSCFTWHKNNPHVAFIAIWGLSLWTNVRLSSNSFF